MDEDDFGDFVASPAPDEPASFAAFDAFPPDTAPSAAVTEAFPPRTQENEAAWDQPAAQTMGEAERDDDDFADYEEVPAPLSNPVFPPAPAPVSASPSPPADDDFGDFDEATPASAAPSPVVERTSRERSAFGDDLVAERSPEAFFEAVDAVLARAFPEAGPAVTAGTDGDGGADAAAARVALARRARDAAGGAGLFAGALESCVAGWAPAVAAGVAPLDAARRAALAPKAWDASPARAALEAALRGALPPAVMPAAPVPSALSLSRSLDAPGAGAPLAGANVRDFVFEVPEASFAKTRIDAADATEAPRGGGGASGADGEAGPFGAFGAFGGSPASPAADATRDERPFSRRDREGGQYEPSLAVEEAAGQGAAAPETGSDPEDAFGSLEAAPRFPSSPSLRPAPAPSEPSRDREDGEESNSLGNFGVPSADLPGFGAFEEAARAREAPPEPGAPPPAPPPAPSEPARLETDPAPATASPGPVPPEPATSAATAVAGDFADLFGPATDAGAVFSGDDSRRESASEAPAATGGAPLVLTKATPDDFVDLFGPVQDTKVLELGAFEASPAPPTASPPAPNTTPPAAEAAEDAFGNFETSPLPSAVGGGVVEGLGGSGDFAAAAAPVDALADLFGDARVVGSPSPAAGDEVEFGAFQ